MKINQYLLFLLFGVVVIINLLSIRIFESGTETAPSLFTSSINPPLSLLSKRSIEEHKATAPPYPLLQTNTDEDHQNLQQPQKASGSQQCKPNVIVYLAQKGNHTSYGRDSYGLLLKSMDLLFTNYLNEYHATATVLVFHTGEFTKDDLRFLEQRQAVHTYGTIQLLDISSTKYWALPDALKGETPKDWFLPDYTVGYRHMMRWYALKLYEFLKNDWHCPYKYVMRMDEESYILSPIQYNIFDFMSTNQYKYSFRMCSFEMRHMKPLWNEYLKVRPNLVLQRPHFFDLCGFYNNWFILDLDWITTDSAVQDWLHWIDETGYIYRKRVNDLIIHTAAVYAFLPPANIHRFLDFTYQHFTNYKKTGCPLWGAIGGGYRDPNALQQVLDYHKTAIQDLDCPKPWEKKPYFPRVQLNMSVADLSPTYHHLPPHMANSLTLPHVAAGHVDLPGVGIRSG